MHPIVVVMAQQAAVSFAKEFGKQAAIALFGGGRSLDARAVSRKLDRILEQIQIINQKLDQLYALVQDLPEVIIGKIRQDRVDEAYILLDSDRILLKSESGNLTAPSQDRALELLLSWRVIVCLESRPGQLMLLPYYTDYLRDRLVNEIDDDLESDLNSKKIVIDKSIELTQIRLDAALNSAEKIITSRTGEVPRTSRETFLYFSEGFKITTDEPYLTWTLADVPRRPRNLEESERNPFSDAVWQRRFLSTQRQLEGALELEHETINREASLLKVQVTVQKMLERYIPFVAIGDGVFSASLAWTEPDLAPDAISV